MKAHVDLSERGFGGDLGAASSEECQEVARWAGLYLKDQTPGRVSASRRMGVTRLREQTLAGKMWRQQISN